MSRENNKNGKNDRDADAFYYGGREGELDAIEKDPMGVDGTLFSDAGVGGGSGERHGHNLMLHDNHNDDVHDHHHKKGGDDATAIVMATRHSGGGGGNGNGEESDSGDFDRPGDGGDNNNNNNNLNKAAARLANNPVKRAFSRVMPAGGFLAGVFNLAGSSLGAGILGLPSAFHSAGVVMGTIYLIVIYLLTVFSFRLLAIVTVRTGIHTYEGMARGLFGRGGDIFTAVVMFVKCFGACVAYVICVSDLWSAFLKDDRVSPAAQTLSFRRGITSITFVVLMLPLSIPKHINSLRYVSLIGVGFIIYFVFCIIAHSATHGLRDIEQHNIVLFTGGNQQIQAIGPFMFAFLAQSNVFAVMAEMKPEPTVSATQWQCFASMMMCTLLYWLAGFFGYADFGPAVGASLLTMYHPLQDIYIAVAYVGIVVKLCVAFALHILPCRDAVLHLLGWGLEETPLWRIALLSGTISVISLICGLFIPKVNTVFGLLGSLTGGFIGFIFPALFFIYAGNFNLRSAGWFDYFGALLLLLCGIIVVCFGTTATIYGII